MNLHDFLGTAGMDNPAVIEICTNCKRVSCTRGVCEQFVERYYEIIGPPTKTRRGKQHGLYGLYLDIKTWGAISGVNPDTVRTRMAKYGKTLFEALGKPSREQVMSWWEQREAK